MELFKKIYWLINPILVVVFMLLLNLFFNIQEVGINAAIAVSLAYILSPKVKIIEKQNGSEEQIKWLFFKKVINHKI
ncbi:MAG: hypothetical protein ACJA1B_000778 [Polaribacter sp.]|jgi:hypothetical protein